MPSTKSERNARLKAPAAEIVSVDKAVDLHRGEWIVMRVTSFDEKKMPLAGQVVAHSRSHSRLLKKVATTLAEAKKQQAHYYIFLGEPRGWTGEDLRRQLEELADQEDRRYARGS